MKTLPPTKWMRIALLLAGACLLANGTCISKSTATGLVDSTATRIVNLVLEAVLIDPLQDTLDRSTGNP